MGSSWRFSSSTCRCFDALDALSGSHCINLFIIMIIIVMHHVRLIIIVGVVSMEPVYLSRRTPFMRRSSHVHLTIRSDVRSSSCICGPIHPFYAELVRHGSVPASNKTLVVLPSLRRSIDARAYRCSFSRARILVQPGKVAAHCVQGVLQTTASVAATVAASALQGRPEPFSIDGVLSCRFSGSER